MADLLKQYQKMADEARLSNLATKAQIEAIHNEIIKRYEPGGTFLTKGEELIQTGKRKATGEQLHQLISSGLYGTTTPGALGQKYEQEVAAPARFKLEDIAMERLSGAQLGKASFLENVQYPYPDYNTLLQAQAAQGAAGRQPTGGGLASKRGFTAGMGGLGSSVTVENQRGLEMFNEPEYGGTPSYTPSGTAPEVSGIPSKAPYSGTAGGVTPSGYMGIAGLKGGGVSTQPRGTGTISGPKGTTTISPQGVTKGLSSAEAAELARLQKMLADHLGQRKFLDVPIESVQAGIARLQGKAGNYQAAASKFPGIY